MKGLKRTPAPGDDQREKPWTQRRAHSRDTDHLSGHTPPAALPASGPASVWQPLATILTTQPVPGPNGGRGMVQPVKMMGAYAETMPPDACSASQRSGAHLVPGTALRAGPWASPYRCPLKLGCLRTSQTAGLRRAGKSEADPFRFSARCMLQRSTLHKRGRPALPSSEGDVCMCAKSLNCVRLFVTPWTVALQAPLSVGFSRQEYWSGLPFLTPGDLPDPGFEPESLCLLHWQADS